MNFTEVKTTDKREDFPTGSRRGSAEGKGRFDLIPGYCLRRLASHFENGAKVYGDRNWEEGQPLHRYMDSALRHIACYLDGMRDEDHLIAAVWNLFGFVWTEEMIRRGKLPAELNDMPSPEKYQ